MENYIAAFILETFSTILNLCSTYIFFDKILLAERCKKERKVTVISLIIVFIIGYFGKMIYLKENINVFIYYIAFFMYYIKCLIFLWNIFVRRYIHIVTVFLYQLVISVVAQVFYMCIQNQHITEIYIIKTSHTINGLRTLKIQ